MSVSEVDVGLLVALSPCQRLRVLLRPADCDLKRRRAESTTSYGNSSSKLSALKKTD